MRLLLDTHTFLWFVFGDAALSTTARDLIEDTDTVALLSVASVWEMAIKNSIGKLPLQKPFAQFLSEQRERNFVFLLPIEESHIVRVSELPMHHRDPFDRMLAAQGLVEGLPILSIDAALDAYGVRRLW